MSGEIEVEFEDTRTGIKLKVKGNPKIVDTYLEKYGYTEVMKECVSRRAENHPPNNIKGPVTLSQSEIPEKPGDAVTLSQYITAIIYSPWGASGRKSTELIELARAHGISLPSSTISGILHRLTKTGKVRRTREPGDGAWIYYPPASVTLARK